MKLLIAVHHRFGLWQVPEWFVERLRRDFPQLEVVHLSSYDRVTEEIAGADIAIAWSLRGEQIQAAKKLKWIHSTATAVHGSCHPSCGPATSSSPTRAMYMGRSWPNMRWLWRSRWPSDCRRRCGISSRSIGRSTILGSQSASARTEWRDHDDCGLGWNRTAAGRPGERGRHARRRRSRASRTSLRRRGRDVRIRTASTRRCVSQTLWYWPFP